MKWKMFLTLLACSAAFVADCSVSEAGHRHRHGRRGMRHHGCHTAAPVCCEVAPVVSYSAAQPVCYSEPAVTTYAQPACCGSVGYGATGGYHDSFPMQSAPMQSQPYSSPMQSGPMQSQMQSAPTQSQMQSAPMQSQTAPPPVPQPPQGQPAQGVQ